jgi:hypothetical protein
MIKIMGKALAKPVVPVPPDVLINTGTVVKVGFCVILPVTSQRWKLLLRTESCITKVSPVLIRAKNTSMSTLPVVKWLMFS